VRSRDVLDLFVDLAEQILIRREMFFLPIIHNQVCLLKSAGVEG
jgi:hypothetical protein